MADPNELRTAIREMILIIQRISDNTGDERENLKSLFSHSTIVFHFLETTGSHEKKQDLTQTMKALIEAVKAKDPTNVDTAIAKLTGLMKDIVTEVKLYAAQNYQRHPTTKSNPPVGKSSDTGEHARPTPIASAPPLQQDVKTVGPEIRRNNASEVEVREKPPEAPAYSTSLGISCTCPSLNLTF
eukprot:Phypoly_transcript_19415.p1 GENE.Phypoly_transcript_19415~~Phypoly_transcript_19415.p1  ORF type:complete len:185 (+),score=18.95 Phypoly_transcript_19415:76-630(+)